MGDTQDNFALTRRGVLMLSAGAAVANFNRVFGFSSDFWNKKEPSQWSGEEIEQLTTKSPWAKETSAQYSPEQGRGGGMNRRISPPAGALRPAVPAGWEH